VINDVGGARDLNARVSLVSDNIVLCVEGEGDRKIIVGLRRKIYLLASL